MSSDSESTVQAPRSTGVRTGQRDEAKAYAESLIWKPGEYVDLDFTDDARTLIHQGKLLSHSSEGFSRAHKWTELFVLLFDNYWAYFFVNLSVDTSAYRCPVVVTEPREQDGTTKYHITRRPLPLQLLTGMNIADPPLERGAVEPKPNVLATLSGLLHPGDSDDSLLVYPCEIAHVGQGGSYILYAESEEARMEWKERLSKAQSLRVLAQEGKKVFDVTPLCGDTGDVAPLNGRVKCSLPFSLEGDEGIARGLVAIASHEGIWIGAQNNLESFRCVLDVKMVTQCTVLEDLNIFVVLADGALSAYPLNALAQSYSSPNNLSPTPLKLSSDYKVVYFSIGEILGRMLLIFMFKKGRDSIFRALEAVSLQTEAIQLPGDGDGGPEHRLDGRCFRVHSDFSFAADNCHGMMFLKSRVAILHQKGFNIMDMTDTHSVTIPIRETLDKEVAKRCDSCRPIKMFRTSENEFLLCYDEFGLFVTRHGDQVHDKALMEWEGKAERIAWHPPYVVVFNRRFIEVHDVETGRLVQIVRGEDMRLTWDGCGAVRAPPEAPAEGQAWVPDSQARIHGVMHAQHMAPGSDAQYVFELVPNFDGQG